ncbi:MAG: hypothetical protein JSR77_09630 [Planctomycetes bacterium]|nr:hypothetical protein [Planctomycetota bacterium]
MAFHIRSNLYGARPFGSAATDANGYANLYFTVPNNGERYIILTAVTGGRPYTSSWDTQVTITR